MCSSAYFFLFSQRFDLKTIVFIYFHKQHLSKKGIEKKLKTKKKKTNTKTSTINNTLDAEQDIYKQFSMSNYMEISFDANTTGGKTYYCKC